MGYASGTRGTGRGDPGVGSGYRVRLPTPGLQEESIVGQPGAGAVYPSTPAPAPVSIPAASPVASPTARINSLFTPAQRAPRTPQVQMATPVRRRQGINPVKAYGFA